LNPKRELIFGLNLFYTNNLILEEKQMIMCSFVYICIAIDNPVIKWEGWDPINQFNPATFCDSPKTGLY
jgi:hypothetical protein